MTIKNSTERPRQRRDASEPRDGAAAQVEPAGGADFRASDKYSLIGNCRAVRPTSPPLSSALLRPALLAMASEASTTLVGPGTERRTLPARAECPITLEEFAKKHTLQAMRRLPFVLCTVRAEGQDHTYSLSALHESLERGNDRDPLSNVVLRAANVLYFGTVGGSDRLDYMGSHEDLEEGRPNKVWIQLMCAAHGGAPSGRLALAAVLAAGAPEFHIPRDPRHAAWLRHGFDEYGTPGAVRMAARTLLAADCAAAALEVLKVYRLKPNAGDLRCAIQSGVVRSVERLLTWGMSPNLLLPKDPSARVCKGRIRPVVLATELNDAPMISLLFKHGAHAARPSDMHTPKR